MPNSTAKEVLKLAKRDKVAFIDLQFSDFLGGIKNVTIPIYRLPAAMNKGVWFDGSSIEGFARIHESDMFLMPDPSTYTLLPWRNNANTGPVARLICDIYKPDHTPFAGDPRTMLKKVLAEAKQMGYEYLAGPECEFFMFPKNEDGSVRLESAGNGYYFNLVLDDTYSIKRQIIDALVSMGITVETSTYEVAHNQHEMDLRYDNALRSADNVMTLKMAAKIIAHKHGYHATFMPKPFYGYNGSGMHTHQSLWKGKKNAFYDKKDSYGLSEVAYQFMAGQLKHAREITGVFAPTVNSYKRLTPGFEAPVYVSWARINRSAMIRVPRLSQGTERIASRIEIRSPDPSSNPYMLFAVLLKAGLEGIKKKSKAPKPVEENLFEFDDAKLAKHYINKLPANLKESIDELQKGTIVKSMMGEHTWRRYIEARLQEWDMFRTSVTEWEVNRYLKTL